MSRIALDASQRDWLASHYPEMTNPEIVEACRERWGLELDGKRRKNFARRAGLRKRQEARNRAVRLARGGMSDAELEFVREYTSGHSWRELADEFERRFGRRLTRSQVTNTRAKLGVHVGCNPGRFHAGSVPKTKGKTWDEYMSPEGQRLIRESGNLFRKGECNAYNEGRRRALLDTYEDPATGDVRVYVDPRGARYPAERWIPYARFVWMQANGREWPDGHHVTFADHDNRNFDPENIVPLPQELVPYVCGGGHGHALPYHDRQSLELSIAHARLALARAKAERALREARPKRRRQKEHE